MDKYFVCILLCIVQRLSVNRQILVPHMDGVIVNSSSQQGPVDKFDIKHAVDGDTSTDAEKCKCCGATKDNNANPWFQVDLLQDYMIQRIHVLGRTDYDHNLYKLEIQLGTTESDGTVLQGVNTYNKSINELEFTLNSPEPFRYITLTLRNRTTFLVICELYVYSVCSVGLYGPGCVNTCGKCQTEPCDGATGACPMCTTGYKSPLCQECVAGLYGPTCDEDCGHCNTSAVCDTSTGSCPYGCSAGYKGTTCTEVCSWGRYGLGCADTCGKCKNNATCNNTHGECTECVTGYNFPLCRECVAGLYGPTCDEDCGHCNTSAVCDKSNGSCPYGCSAGYKGTTCTEVCSWGRYGLSCADTCGKCKNNATCNNTHGECTECVTGYNFPMCRECVDGRYGPTCDDDCGHCYSNAVCDKSNGSCPNGCSAGYKGTTCTEVCSWGRYGLGCADTCGKCENNATCNNTNGECTACVTGYNIPMCRECVDGRYGPTCDDDCGHCYSNAVCDKSNGSCPNGCSAGYKGTTCTEVCSWGRYGLSCADTCGKCENNATCNNTNGECTACVTGYNIPMCRECVDGRYGPTCDEDCGHCYSNAVCDKSNGSCSNGCSAGYKGTTCTEVCSWGRYGLGCADTCGKCENSATCNNTNGKCTACVTGYNIPMCRDCIDGRYSTTCNEDCGNCINNDVCDNGNGTCSRGCSAGFQGTTCKGKCENGTHGLGCQKQCGNCSNNDPCNPIDGVCATCAAGYKGNTCVDVCLNGTFGENCIQPCGYCLNNTDCEPAFGECEVGCVHGYYPPYCIEAVALRSDESNVPVEPIVGTIAGAVLVAIFAVVAVFLLKRRRKENSLSRSNQSFQDIHDNDVADNPVQEQPEASVHVKREENASSMENMELASVTHQPSVPSVPNEPEIETENIYYAFLSKKSDLKICQLWDYINFKKTEDCVFFYQEYSRLSNKLKHSYDVAMKPQNRGKNRYKGLFAYDHSRVPLVVEDDKEVEYINASFIDGYDKPHKFIASQGPIESMRDDFWRMIWQHKSKNIVMLTNLIENGADKCILYWPVLDKKTVTYGKITITLLSENSTVDYVIRHMKINKEGEDSTLPVTQFHYKAWPDKSYPDSTWSLVKFWLKVEDDTTNVTDSGPMVVHCSAGIGRTGTYIALDNAYYQAKNEGTVRILDVVKSLREQRIGMVQTKDQYVYLHEAVADALLFGTHFIWSSQFEDAYNFLSQKEKGSYITRLHIQFNIIVESIFDKRSVHTTVEDGDNLYSNIFIQKKPAQVSIDEYRPKSKSLVYVQEVGALILQNHEAKDAFIVCKSPTESRMTEFWSLVKEQNVKTIVSLVDVSMTSSKRSSFLGLKNKAVQDMFGLSLAEERKTSIFTERKIYLKDNTDDITISQFEYNNWASGDNVPKDPSSMAQFVDVVLDRQRRLSETDPVLIYCNNGAQRCGVICALLSEVYRMIKDGGHINIIETVKMMKERSDSIIANVDQYVFIHDVIRSRIQDHTYQN